MRRTENIAQETSMVEAMSESGKLKRAEKTIERELKKKLGKKSKSILKKIDKMTRANKKRSEVEKMMVKEISEYTKRNLEKFALFIT